MLVLLAGRMNVFRFGDELDPIVRWDSKRSQDTLVIAQSFAIHNQQLMLIKLNFLWNRRIEHGDASASIICEQIFEVPQGT